MKVGVAKESAPGETRVAVVPDTVRRLVGDGVEVLVERGAGETATFADAAYEEAGARLVSADGSTPRPTSSARCASRPPRRSRACARARCCSRSCSRSSTPSSPRAGRARRDGLLHGLDPARDARPADGRALLAEHRRRLQGGRPRRRAPGQVLPDADDRRGHDPAGEGARPRRGRRRPAGDRHGAAPRRGRLGLRRAPGREGAGGEPRRDLPRARRRGRRGRRRLRRRARRGPARARAGADRPPRRRVRRRDHDRADPGPARAGADHGGAPCTACARAR